jgi:hypothetical protein
MRCIERVLAAIGKRTNWLPQRVARAAAFVGGAIVWGIRIRRSRRWAPPVWVCCG